MAMNRLWRVGVMALALANGCGGPGPSDEAAEALTPAKAVLLASGQEQPGNLVIDDLNVYWSTAGNAAEDGSIRMVPKSGGSVATLASGQNVPFGLAVDSGNVYWTNFDAGGNDGQIMVVSRTGGAPVVLAGGLSAPRDIVVDALYVYVLTSSSVVRVSKWGGPAIAIAPAICGGSLAADETSLYWTENCVLFPPQGIVKVSKLGGLPVFLSTLAPGQLAVDATSLYFGANASLEVLSKYFGGLALPLDAQPVTALTVDSSYVYWISSPQILRTPKLGGATQTITSDANSQGIAVDNRSIYWFDFGVTDGAIWTVPLPR